MHKLIVIADPTNFTEIFEITELGQMHKISQLYTPQESVEFIKNYSDSVQKNVDVIYKGPDDYIRYFVSQANKLDFVTAYMNEMENIND